MTRSDVSCLLHRGVQYRNLTGDGFLFEVFSYKDRINQSSQKEQPSPPSCFLNQYFLSVEKLNHSEK